MRQGLSGTAPGTLLRSRLGSSNYVERTEVGLIHHDKQGTVVDCNRAAAELFGSSRGDFIGMTIDEQNVGIVRQDSSEFRASERPVMVSIRERHAISAEIMGIDRFGQQRRWVEASTYPVFFEGEFYGILSSYLDVTQQEERRRMLELRGRVNALITDAPDEPSALQHLCDVVVRDGGYDLAWVGVLSEGGDGLLEIPFSSGVTDYLYEGIVSTLESDSRGNGPTGTAFRTGRTQVANNFTVQVGYEPWRQRAEDFKLSSAIALPFSASSKMVLNVYDRHIVAFDDVLVEGFQEIVHEVELGCALLRSKTECQRIIAGTIRALARLTEARDPYTQGHQARVGDLSAAIATQLGVDEDLVRLIQMSGQVHDIGKITVPAEMLTRPGRLSNLEFEIVKTHCAVGNEILRSASLPWPIPEAAWQHHERLDGSGYPRGLKGDEIILPARILSVADVIEAMMNHRPYRPALGYEQAIAEVTAGRGTLFDPDVVDACRAVFDAGFAFDQRSVFTLKTGA
jgi:PAS domain S-box-containing protein